MGLFRHTRSTSNSQSAEEPSDKLFPKEGIKCKSSLDKKTLERLYDALYEDNYDTYDDNNMRDALSSLDANVYNLLKAIIFQNFLLQRRIEELSDKVDALQSKK
jgi:hypothetical protein